MPQALPVRRIRRSSLGVLVATFLVVLAAPATGLAAMPQMVGDGRLTVTVVIPDEAGGGPFVGIDVLLTAVSDGSVVGDVLGTTDDAGTVIFDDLPVSDGATAVDWIVEAQALETTVDPTGCETMAGWAASDIVPSDIEIVLSLTVQAISETTCPDDPGEIEGIVFDGILDVTVTDDASPVPDALVTVLAVVDDEELLFKAGETTDADGRVTVSELPRPDIDGPAVTWQVRVETWAEAEIDGCRWARIGTGAADIAATEGSTSVAIDLTWVDDSAVCDPPPDGSPLIHGTALDASGAPFAVEQAGLVQQRADGAAYYADVVVDETGAFGAPVHAWGTADAPATIKVAVRGPITRTVTDGDCFWQYALVGEGTVSVALADGGAPPDIAIVATEQEVSGGCGATGTPVPGDGSEGGGPVTAPGEPAITLPPTDVKDTVMGRDRGGSITPALLLLSLVGVIAILMAGSVRRSSAASGTGRQAIDEATLQDQEQE